MVETIEKIAERVASAPSDALERLGRAPIQPRPLAKCFYCNGTGYERTKWSWLWGGVCWICGGWGAIDPDKPMLRGPLAPHPYRI